MAPGLDGPLLDMRHGVCMPPAKWYRLEELVMTTTPVRLYFKYLRP